MPHHAGGPSRGRLQGHRHSHSKRQAQPEPKPPYPPPEATIQAYEANLIWDESTRAAEQVTRSVDLPESSREAGRGLIRWQGEGEEIWVDRYDILHLLPSIPRAGPFVPPTGRPRSSSPTSSAGSSWDDVPSDQEETFELSSDEEYEAYERNKRVQQLAKLREARLEEREKEDKLIKREEEKKQSKGWGGDEVPPDPILTLMSHTALSLSVSPNPAVLEMRILTNHSTDDRFSFLRGRYRDTWTRVKDQVRRDKRQDPKVKQREEENVGMLVGGYESDSDDPLEPDSPPPPPPEDEGPPPPDRASSVALEQGGGRLLGQVGLDEEEARRQERRARVEEWKRKRAAQAS